MSRMFLPLLLTLVLPPLGAAKDKTKITIPGDVLNAHTVLVVIKPGAGEPLTDPNANHRAQEDVEKALIKWGRFDLALEPRTADLVIAIRNGNGKAVSPTIKGGPIDQRPVILEPQDGSIRIGGQHGKSPDVTRPDGGNSDTSPRVQTEVGSPDDSFEVYRGGVEYPLDSSPVWRYVAKDALRPPNIPAVEQFRKAIDEAAKAAAKKKPQP
jgi:hypothetical protein